MGRLLYLCFSKKIVLEVQKMRIDRMGVAGVISTEVL